MSKGEKADWRLNQNGIMERQPKAKMPHNAKLMFEVELEHID
jgi:FKBP-type peptidyl-prolyl cis-trans isomerase